MEFLRGEGNIGKESERIISNAIIGIASFLRCSLFEKNTAQHPITARILPIADLDAEKNAATIPQITVNPQEAFVLTFSDDAKKRRKKGKISPAKKPNLFLSAFKKMLAEV